MLASWVRRSVGRVRVLILLAVGLPLLAVVLLELRLVLPLLAVLVVS
jgi:hypothetical protein